MYFPFLVVLVTSQADPSSFMLNIDQASLSDPQSDFVENFFEKGFRFVINVTKLDTYDIETPEFFLSNDEVSWKVLLTKRTSSNDNETVLAVSLMSIFAENLTNEMYKVNAVLKLLNQNQQVSKTVINGINGDKFSKVNPQHEFGEISDWNGFLQQHVNGDKAIFECEISIEPHYEREFELISAKFHFLIEHLSQLQNSSTSEFQVNDIDWRILVERHQNSLGIFLCANPDDLHLSLSWTVEGTFQILSLQKNVIPTFRQFKFIFHRRDLCQGFKQFIDWRELIDPRNEYAVNDAAIFQIEMRVLPPKSLWN